MKTIFSSVATALVLLLALSCTEHNIEPMVPEFANGRVVGSVHGVLTDFTTQTRFDSMEVKVSWVVDGDVKSKFNDTLGYYIITDLPSGDYDITFHYHEDYAVSRIHVHVPTLEEIVDCCGATDKDYPYSVVADVYLYKLNAGLRGTVYAREDDQAAHLAQGVTMIADFNPTGHSSFTNITPNIYTTVTNEQGQFTFENLPAMPMVTLRTFPYNDGTYNFGVYSKLYDLVPGKTKDAGDIILEIATAEPFIVQNNFINVQNFGLTDDLRATFSKSMDTTTFEIELSRVEKNGVDDEEMIESHIAWTNNITVVIDPIVPLESGSVYQLFMSGKSLDNNDFEATLFTFSTPQGIEFISTNLERAQGVFDQFDYAQTISLTFSAAVDINNSQSILTLRDEDDAYVKYTASQSTDQKTVFLRPNSYLEPGQTYDLHYKLYSFIPADFVEGVVTFTTVDTLVVPPVVTGFSLMTPSASQIDFNTTRVKFRWTTVRHADGYIVYARDNHKNTDLVAVAQWYRDDRDFMITDSGTVDLSQYSQFDTFKDDDLFTPFEGGNQITFYIRAFNDAGLGPMSSALTLYDRVVPYALITQSGNADNTGGKHASFTVTLSQTEYLHNTVPTFTFTEAGGESDFVLNTSNVTWVWNWDMRGGYAVITVPSGRCAAGDRLTVRILDSSGNANNSNTINLTPIINITQPAVGVNWEAPGATIQWTVNNTSASPTLDNVNILFSTNGGTTWRTIQENVAGATNSQAWAVPDTLMSLAESQTLVGLTDARGGYYIWKSPAFSISGIKVTSPAAGIYYDRGGTDSTIVPIRWTSNGITTVRLEYSANEGASWTTIITKTNDGIYDWYAPDIGADYNVIIRVSDADADYRPWHISRTINIVHR
ncbi:Ig-like domain-containing protein [bacterium]|nr:Ig-like domain-containing protein [bacterium]